MSISIQFLSFLIITVLLRYSDDTPRDESLAKASIVFFFIYYGAFGAGLLVVPWLYPTEINSLPMRTKGAAVATATNWITNFVIVEITPIRIQNLGWKFYIVWTVFCFAFLPVIYFFYPVTVNRTLEDLDAYYRSYSPLWVYKSKDGTSVKRPQEYIQHEIELVGEVNTGSIFEAQVHGSIKE
ncbi:hypothetical protein FOMG_02460 [Fusarium oxysporum f. sp. melonis 26406]|uniref:Major facilitator superfamily (MFS) profile domain-containing protein n=1 Tax=Fusarium oxysporum f. sp. melonis 26406 TaxID=1089452 RepID=X0AHB5_FUSOX|nr:hypothetical protein FOMG_02460 [Fusarium oxysporum f. sp. melonis 26406]